VIAARSCQRCGALYLTHLFVRDDVRLWPEHWYCTPCIEACEQQRRVRSKNHALAKLRAATVARHQEHEGYLCDFCGKPIGDFKRITKRYCSDYCCKEAHRERRGVSIEPRARRAAA
jgi:hypothetical protein